MFQIGDDLVQGLDSLLLNQMLSFNYQKIGTHFAEKAKITNLDAKPGDLYLARLRSYPPWPSLIADEEMLPDVLLNTRPVTAQKADGTYNEAYADGGKKVADRTYPVMFLYTNEL